MKEFAEITKQSLRLEVRPLQASDYEVWIAGFAGQKNPQNKYDEGPFDYQNLTNAWFDEAIKQRKQLAMEDKCYKFNVFRLLDGASVGFCIITTHRRDEFQYASIGYPDTKPTLGSRICNGSAAVTAVHWFG